MGQGNLPNSAGVADNREDALDIRVEQTLAQGALPDHARRSEENHFHLTVSCFSRGCIPERVRRRSTTREALSFSHWCRHASHNSVSKLRECCTALCTARGGAADKYSATQTTKPERTEETKGEAISNILRMQDEDSRSRKCCTKRCTNGAQGHPRTP